jgi:NAD-dependent deacetylase
MKQKIVVLTGAGMSADSGIKTFRDAGGLWEGHDVMEVASPQGFRANPTLVLDFYNQRRRQLKEVQPNEGHTSLVQLETHYDVSIITQNVDDLHERAGSQNVLHLHGELLKVRSTIDEHDIYEWHEDLLLGDTSHKGHQLRPHIVWFGEEVPLLEEAASITSKADIIIIIGTSLQVYPAAGLMHYAAPKTPIYFVDPKPTISKSPEWDLHIIPKSAAIGVPILVLDLLHRAL